jgi:glycosyltransferase involved in cell wall biosynthesis
MRLLIVSHTPHYLKSGTVVGWGPTVREIDYLANLFDEVVHIAPLHTEAAPASALAYHSRKVINRFVKPAGGEQFSAKVKALTRVPSYSRILFDEFMKSDVVHVRCPANISLVASVSLAFIREPNYRWIKYAGNWQPIEREPTSYKFQRWWLRMGMHRGVTTVNGKWPDQSEKTYSFFNPCLTEKEIAIGKYLAEKKQLVEPIKILFVGAVNRSKGVDRVLIIARALKEQGVRFEVDIVGDGLERATFEELASFYELESHVRFHGWISREELATFYARAHFLLLPSKSEGWPKVLSEAMAYGAVPITSNVSSIPQIIKDIGAGVALPVDNIELFVAAVLDFCSDPDKWNLAKESGSNAAFRFGYQYYLESVRAMFQQAWGIIL